MGLRDLARAVLAEQETKQTSRSGRIVSTCPVGHSLGTVPLGQRSPTAHKPNLPAPATHFPLGHSLAVVPAGQPCVRRQVGTGGTRGTDGTLRTIGTSGTAEWQERALILEYTGLPRSWAEPFARLLTGPPPRDFSPTRWESIRDNALPFADRWAAEAHRLSWDAHDVFGLHPIAPSARVDCRGVAWLLGDGSKVVAIDACGADIETPRGGRQRYRRQAYASKA
jgi:hypothetical protein